MASAQAASSTSKVDYEGRLKGSLSDLIRRYQLLHHHLASEQIQVNEFLQSCNTLFTDFINHLNDVYPQETLRRFFEGAYPLHHSFDELQDKISNLRLQYKSFEITHNNFTQQVVSLCSTFLRVLERKEQKLNL